QAAIAALSLVGVVASISFSSYRGRQEQSLGTKGLYNHTSLGGFHVRFGPKADMPGIASYAMTLDRFIDRPTYCTDDAVCRQRNQSDAGQADSDSARKNWNVSWNQIPQPQAKCILCH